HLSELWWCSPRERLPGTHRHRCRTTPSPNHSLPAPTKILSGSPLFSVESELRQAKLSGHEVKHGDQVCRRAVAASFAFGSAKDAVQSFHERIGHSPLPVRQDSCQMVLDHLRHLEHRGKEAGLVETSHPAHPPTPHFETMPRR